MAHVGVRVNNVIQSLQNFGVDANNCNNCSFHVKQTDRVSTFFFYAVSE